MEEENRLTIGVLALQGAFIEHVRSLHATDEKIKVVMVKKESDLSGLQGLIIPGGESTTMKIVGRRQPGLLEALQKWIQNGNPTMVTIAD